MSDLYRCVFPKRNTLLIVVHVESEDQALRNVKIAFDGGADGVFLINHSVPASKLSQCYNFIRSKFPKEWIGLNWLDLSPSEGLNRMCPSMDGMWVDNAGIQDEENGGAKEAKEFAATRGRWEKERGCSFLLFGGVAFKYQQPVHNLGLVTQTAALYVDVITTSGNGTGMAPDIDKIRAMRRAAGDHPLAVASGITPENVMPYKEYVNCFLVATGVSDSPTELNPSRVRQFAKRVSR